MLTVLQVLNEKPVQKNDEREQEKMKHVYENMLLKLVKNFKKTADDKWEVLDPIIEYVWMEFDDAEFHTLNAFKTFLRWSFSLLNYFKKTTIKNLHSFSSI